MTLSLSQLATWWKFELMCRLVLYTELPEISALLAELPEFVDDVGRDGEAAVGISVGLQFPSDGKVVSWLMLLVTAFGVLASTLIPADLKTVVLVLMMLLEVFIDG